MKDVKRKDTFDYRFQAFVAAHIRVLGPSATVALHIAAFASGAFDAYLDLLRFPSEPFPRIVVLVATTIMASATFALFGKKMFPHPDLESGLPGGWVQRALRCIVSEKTLEREVKPAIADMQYEYARAAAEPRWRRAFILGRGYFSIACTLGVGGFVRLAKAIWKSATP